MRKLKRHRKACPIVKKLLLCRTTAAHCIRTIRMRRPCVRIAKYLSAGNATWSSPLASCRHWAWPMICGRAMPLIDWQSSRSRSWKPFAQALASPCWHAWRWKPAMPWKSKSRRLRAHSTQLRTWPGIALEPAATRWHSRYPWRTYLRPCKAMLRKSTRTCRWSYHAWEKSSAEWPACCWRPTRKEQRLKNMWRLWFIRQWFEERCGGGATCMGQRV